MRTWQVKQLATILEAIRAGQPVDEKALRAAESAVQRELAIKSAAAQRSRDFFATRIYRSI